jgi:hypothetical protein
VGALEYGIDDVPLATDLDRDVASRYDVMKWAVATGEPGHTFILVNADGIVVWIRDYGAPENGGVMYVQPMELTQQIRDALGK